MMPHRFRNRAEAGRELATKLGKYANRRDVIVFGLPRGGVPVAYEVAKVLGAPLDVFVVRKLGFPMHPELAMGAIASGGVRVVDDRLIRDFGITDAELAAVAREEERELERRELRYREQRAFPDVRGKTAILVDDGLATGSTMRAAAAALRAQGPARVVVAVPVAAAETCDEFRDEVDDVICAITPDPFHAVGLWYEDFSQTSDQEVHDLLARRTSTWHGSAGRPASDDLPAR